MCFGGRLLQSPSLLFRGGGIPFSNQDPTLIRISLEWFLNSTMQASQLTHMYWNICLTDIDRGQPIPYPVDSSGICASLVEHLVDESAHHIEQRFIGSVKFSQLQKVRFSTDSFSSAGKQKDSLFPPVLVLVGKAIPNKKVARSSTAQVYGC